MTPQQAAPERIGRYEIIDQLGQGGMATVYRAHDPSFDRTIALKVMPHALMHDPTFRARFEREARTIAMLEHAGIVPVYDYGEDNGQPFIAMRYMPGGSLAERLEKGPLSLAEAVRMVDRLAPALDEAHLRGIVHRDLKPGNILFDASGDAYIADFGIAKLSQESLALTGSATIGTPAYMSPEQARGELAIDGRSDVYSLGAILFEALTGKLPYEAETPMGIAVRHITDPVPRILDVNPSLPPGCEDLIDKAMAKDRDERFITTLDLAAALRAVASGEALAPTKVVRPEAVRPSAPAADEAPTFALVREPPVTAPAQPPAAGHPTGSARATQAVRGLLDGKKKRSPGQLILLGLALLAVLIVVTVVGRALRKFSWPGYILLPGAIVLYLASRERRPGLRLILAATGSFVTGLGLLLQYQALFQHFQSWAYAWALVVLAAPGAGLVMAERWGGEMTALTKVGRITTYAGLGLFGVGWLVADAIGNMSEKPVAAVIWLPIFAGTAAVLALQPAWFRRRREKLAE
jgi:serine/threonine-protein kinase